MWRRVSNHLHQTLIRSRRSDLRLTRPISSLAQSKPLSSPFVPSSFGFARRFSSGSDAIPSKVEDVMPIATGHEKEELEAALQGRDLLDINHPSGPFGTKEEPSVIKSYYDKRIVGCPGGEEDDEHDVVWFWLEKGKPHECPVCTQYFILEVVGPGGPPDGHGDEEHH